MSRYFTSKLSSLKPYTPGEQPKEREYVKLNTNESPFSPSPKAIKMAEETLSKLMLYPDPDMKELTLVMAERLGIGTDEIIWTNGSDDVLNFAFMAFCDENTPAVFPDITYGFYSVFAQVQGVSYRTVPLKDDFSICPSDYYGAKGTIFIANPNAPTGLALSLEEIEGILKNNPDNVVVIDEAYVDFGGETCIPLTKKYDNLLVTQTFSKSRSMAGARLGFGVGNKELISDLNRIRYSTNPYNINSMTMAAGIGTVLDHDYFVSNVNQICENRKFISDELKKRGFEMTQSLANFIFTRHRNLSGKYLYEELKKRGVLVRHFEKDRISDYCRITIGSLEQMKIFLEQIDLILEENV